MVLPPPPPKTVPTPPPAGAGAASASAKKEPEIVVIPEKFYGMALKMKAETPPPVAPVPPPKPKAPSPPGPIKKKPVWPWIVLVVVLLLVVGGGFVYFNRELLFPQAPPPVVVEPTPPAPPSAPVGLSATVASGTTAVALSWVDTSGDETGYRLERREGLQGTFLPLTNLSVNSGTFLDVTVQSSQTYAYRVIAVGPGGESAPSNEATVTVGVSAPPPPPGPELPPGGLDSDSDGLSDQEEPLYGTDSRAQDSDRDGFLDGNEVFHLYNPAATAPVRLIDSGLVKLLQASAGWRILVPTPWTTSLAAPDGASAIIRTGQGETFNVSIEDNPNGLSVPSWYSSRFPGSAPLRAITTKGGLEGFFDNERLRAVFAWDGKVFMFAYDLGGNPFINYRTTFEMMLNSLVLEGAPVLTSTSELEGPGGIVSAESATSSATTTSP